MSQHRWKAANKSNTLWQCESCGLQSHKCFAGQCPRPAQLLGDHTEQLLSSIGITKDRYVEAKERFGLAPTCSCDKRKEWLNRVGAWFGIEG